MKMYVPVILTILAVLLFSGFASATGVIVVTQNSPANLTVFNISSPTFNFTVVNNISAATSLNCSLFIDNILNITNSSTKNNTLTGITATSSIADGNHSWYVRCNDTIPNTNTSQTLNFTIATTAPTVTLSAPASSAIFNVSSITFNFTATSDVFTTMSCSLYLDGVLNKTNAATSNGTLTSMSPTSSMADGNHTWNVSCTDGASNVGAGLNKTFTVATTAPTVTLSAPTNLSIFNVSSITFNFTATSDAFTTLSCSLYLDGVLNKTNAATSNGTLTSMSPTSTLADGAHTWNVSCTDGASNVGAGLSRTFTVGTTAPTVSLTSPASSSTFNFGTSSVTFTFNFTSTSSSTANCSLYLDGGLSLTNSSTNNNTPTSFTASGLSYGSHSWYVSCIDSANNTGNSSTYGFIISTPPSSGNSGGSGSSSAPTNRPSLSASISSTCSGNTVTVSSSTGPVSGAEVLIDDGTIILYTGADGTVSFPGCGSTANVEAVANGYSAAYASTQLIGCSQCVPAANTTAPAPVQPPSTQPATPSPTTSPSKPSSNSSTQPPAKPPAPVGALTGPASISGGSATISATVNGRACQGCQVKITGPSGSVSTETTGANGNFVLSTPAPGAYTVSLYQNGTLIKSLTFNALAQAPAVTQPTTPSQQQTAAPANSGTSIWLLIGIVVVILLILGGAYYLLYGKKPKRGL